MRNQNGYTLLETIIALAVILSALAGPVSLIIRGIHNFSFSKNKIIAVNLAQEGIELIRVIRENNQICIEKEGRRNGPPRTWQTDYDGSIPSSLLGTNRTADALAIRQYSCGSVTIRNPTLANFGAACATTPLRINANGNYNYTDGQPTIFSRCISITRPSGSESGPQGLTIPPADMMDVALVVSWLERDIQRSISLTERLYNWK